jgi:LmbE family N-acetylglucosaminyl deacetylase
MPLTDRARIEREARRPAIVSLWRALAPLRSTVSFMSSGAHPDDEASGMLAALGWRDGIDLSYACSTRGEGGQNDIGTEAGAELGTLRTAEMEAAAEVLGLRLYWHSQSPADTIRDFGFSKSGTDTLARWGHARTLARFVEILRRERPDCLCPTFLDVPGQHGHHRAMTQAAREAMQAAADPAFPGTDLAPWQVKKLYLPAWSGAGQAYDDDEAPPPATLSVTASGLDPVTGWSHARIGQQSRAFHATQGMGAWVPAGAERDYPLHLAQSHVPGPDIAIASGLPANLGELAAWAGAPELAAPLAGAQGAIDAALAAFPDTALILRAATRALAALRDAIAACPARAAAEVLHRLARKEAQLATLIRIAAGVEVIARLDRDLLRPGETARLTLEQRHGTAAAVAIAPDLPAGWSLDGDRVALAETVPPSDPYPDSFFPDAPRAPALTIAVTAHGLTSESRLPFEVTPLVAPAVSARLTPATAILNTAAPAREIEVAVDERHPAAAAPALALPAGWRARPTARGLRLTAPQAPAEALHEMALSLGGAPAASLRLIGAPHTETRLHAAPAVLRLRCLRVELPEVRLAYVGGGNDRVAHWLDAMGLAVRRMDDATLADPSTLDGLDTLVIGIFALRTRPALRAALPRIHAWVRAGGNLLTLYHRPWDAWDPAATPPLRLEIGQPSLRWRVTDAAAEVTQLAPAHPLLTGPNPIGPQDWAGWVKERGLYFARSWDPAYQPLLSMSDAGEPPLAGALVSAAVGAGRHTHCALVLHIQMEALVPGAFRLMANLVA